MNSSMNTEKLRDHWVAELTPPPAAGADGAVSEPLLQALLRELGTAAVPILRPNPGHTWIWSDLHLGDLAMVEAWNRPFRNLTHMNRALLAEWRRRIRSSDTIICLGDVAHPNAWRDHSRLQLDLAGCPGERLLILGNHDFHTREELALAGFDKQYAAAVCDTGPVLILTHMPLSRGAGRHREPARPHPRRPRADATPSEPLRRAHRIPAGPAQRGPRVFERRRPRRPRRRPAPGLRPRLRRVAAPWTGARPAPHERRHDEA